MWNRLILLLLCGLASTPLAADSLRLAVASNARAVMTDISRAFSEHSDIEVQLAFASSGVHYAQIRQGAPFDAWFAADVVRPQRAEADGLGVAGSRYTWAIGQLALWSPDEQRVDSAGRVLAAGGFQHLALANPRLAPYGAAARQTLESLNLWESMAGRLVMGENVAQAMHFVDSGNAELGLVAWSQVLAAGSRGSWWRVPATLHQPIEQQALMLRDSEAARALFEFMRGAQAQGLLEQHGYLLP